MMQEPVKFLPMACFLFWLIVLWRNELPSFVLMLLGFLGFKFAFSSLFLFCACICLQSFTKFLSLIWSLSNNLRPPFNCSICKNREMICSCSGEDRPHVPFVVKLVKIKCFAHELLSIQEACPIIDICLQQCCVIVELVVEAYRRHCNMSSSSLSLPWLLVLACCLKQIDWIAQYCYWPHPCELQEISNCHDIVSLLFCCPQVLCSSIIWKASHLMDNDILDPYNNFKAHLLFSFFYLLSMFSKNRYTTSCCSVFCMNWWPEHR